MSTEPTSSAPAEAPKPKPPAQGVGVVGIEAKPIVLTPTQVSVNWELVATLPPFQMFVHEQVPTPADRDSQRWAQEYAVRRAAQRGDQDLLDEYFAWHEKKGYWPKETPFGELKE